LSEVVLRRIWIAAIVVIVAAIVTGSLTPRQAVPVEQFSDKLGHFLAYLALALAVSGISAPRRLWRSMLGCFLLGASLELAQAAFTEHRSAEWADLAANTAGIATAWLISAQGRAGWGLRAGVWLARRGR
jgi:VanZ family protein